MYILCFLLAIFFAVVVLICFDTNRFVVREYTVYSEKVDKNTKIVLLSDMHNKQFGKDNYKLIGKIREIDPDIICSAGDMLVARPGKKLDIALSLFDYLKEYKVYYSIGNHEFRMKLYEDKYPGMYLEYLAELKKRGVTVLENECCYLPDSNIRIQGIMIDREYYKRRGDIKMEPQYIEGLINSSGEIPKDSDYIIGLAHNPEYFEEYAKAGIDLVFSGHNHGGVVKLPVLGGVISPRLKIFPKYDGGIFTSNGRTMVLSRGLGCHTIPVRLFNPGELVVVNLSPCKKG